MIYLNNAATSFPKPEKVIEAVNHCLSNPVMHAARTGFERERDDHIYLCRESIAKLINISDPLQIILTSGSTEALNLAINGLELNRCHVVTTSIEHNSVLRPLKTLERMGKIDLTIVQCDEATYVQPELIKEAVREDTKLIVINHCSNVTGTILDVKKIADIAHSAGAFLLVDASQSAGAIPIDFDGWNLDFLAFTGHKSLYGIQGTGGLAVRKGISLKPLKVGGTGILSEILFQPDGYPIHYEAGTPNTPGIISLGAGVEWVLETGIDTIHAQKKKLFNLIISELKEYDRIKIYNKTENHSHSNFCFNIEGMVPEEAGYMLDSSFDIIVRTGLHCAPLVLESLGVHPWGTVRASWSYFTTEDEIAIFIDALKQMTKVGRR